MRYTIKYAYLKSRHKLRDVSQVIESSCEICNKNIEVKLRFSCYGKGSVERAKGHFHHKKKENKYDNLQLVCFTCHKRLHDLGLIQRWLKKIGKRFDELPDCTNLKPMKKGW